MPQGKPPPLRSLAMTERSPLRLPLGRTQASSVSAPVGSRLAASAADAIEELPLKVAAAPYLPELDQVTPVRLSVLPWPDASAAEPPVPSSNEKAAIGAGAGGAF